MGKSMLASMGARIRTPAFATTLALCVQAAAAAPPAPTVPLAAFFGAPEIGSVSLSPSGQTLAMTVPGKNQRMELVAADLDQQPLRFKSLAWLTDYDVAHSHWLHDKRLVFDVFDSQAGEWAGITGLWAVDADGENGRMLIDPYWAGFRAVVPGNRNILSAEWALHSLPMDGSDDVLVVERAWNSFRGVATAGLARLSTQVPRPQRLSGGAPEGAQHWITDDKGQPQVLEAVQQGQRKIYRRDAKDAWQEMASFDAAGLHGWAPRFVLDGDLFVAQEVAGEPGTRLLLWDPERAAPQLPAVLAAKGFDVGDNAQPLVNRPGGQLLGWRYRLDTVYTRWLDPAMVQTQAAVDRALPGRVNVIECRDCLAARRLLVLSLSDRMPPSYSVMERASGKFTHIGSAHPDVPPGISGGRSFQRITARDGRSMPVYVTRPAGKAAGPLPAVLYIHGGPHSRVNLDWSGDAVPQFLASRGYVVVEPEFRGSAGYGAEHQKAGWRQWGGTMQDDMHDALQWAITQGVVDKNKVCIMGASYGGYAALMGPVRYPEAFRCAISWVAPTDLPQMVRELRQLVGVNDAWTREVKSRFGSEEDLRSTSPLVRAAELRVPVLAAWGVDDQRVPIAHGRDFRDAARAAKVELEYVEYASEGHVWMKPATRLDFFGRAEKLLARTLGGP